MVRFIDLGDQIDFSGDKQFAFYNTVTDQFFVFNGQSSFDSVEDLKLWFDRDDIDRFIGLIPSSYFGDPSKSSIQHKRFMVFGSQKNGGMFDVVASFENIDDAIWHASTEVGPEAQIFDRVSGYEVKGWVQELHK